MRSTSPPTYPPLQGRAALITGASRGIGREIALTLARAGCAIAVAAKSVTDTPNLPGTIHTVADEVRKTGAQALALQLDVRDDVAVRNVIRAVVKRFGRLDYLVCNSGALWWRNVEETPMTKYDLVNGVNVRGTFCCVREALPVMKEQGFGRIIVMSPPVELSWIPGKVAYSISKYGMTMIAMGLSKELRGTGISINALWPCTLIESFATKNFEMASRKHWRKASILADSVLHLVQEPDSLSGEAVIDEDYLREKGVTDFAKYQCVEGVEPPKVWPLKNSNEKPWHPNPTGAPRKIAARL